VVHGKLEALRRHPILYRTENRRIPSTFATPPSTFSSCAQGRLGQINRNQRQKAVNVTMTASTPRTFRSNANRIILVDRHPLVRVGVRTLLEPLEDIDVVGEADSAEAAERVARERKPDLIVIDPLLTPISRSAGTRSMLERFERARVLALSAHADVPFVRAMMSAGLAGFVLKRADCDELLRAIRVVARGGTYIDPVLTGTLLSGPRASAATSSGASLSEREDQVLRLIARGYSAKEISAALGVSLRTLETYRTRAMRKLKLRSRVDLVRFAARAGWLTDE
jgi:DNA-binding NarL/FixJ family response regulator